MRKKTKIILVLLILILVLPIPNFAIKDGGTKTYTALTYKIVDWNRLVGSGNITIQVKSKGITEFRL